MGTFAYVCTF